MQRLFFGEGFPVCKAPRLKSQVPKKSQTPNRGIEATPGIWEFFDGLAANVVEFMKWGT